MTSKPIVLRIPLNPLRDYSYVRFESDLNWSHDDLIAVEIADGNKEPIKFLLTEEQINKVLKKSYQFLQVLKREKEKFKNENSNRNN